MFPKRSKKQGEITPRRRRIYEDDLELPASAVNNQFRRNQTLSSYKHTTPDESSRRKAHHLALQRRKLGGVFAIVITVVALLLFLLWQLIAQISITTSTKHLHEAFQNAAYEKVVNEYLSITLHG